MLSADQPVAMVAVRLCDIRPDGGVTRVSYGLLNLTQRDSREQPAPLEPGRYYRVRVQLNDIAYRFPAGHRIRLAISSNYWPLVWPAPQPVTLEMHEADSVLILPQRPPAAEDADLTPFKPAEASQTRATTVIEPACNEHRIKSDAQSGEIRVEISSGGGRLRIEKADLEVLERIEECYRCREHDPLSVSAQISTERALRRGDWSVRIDTYTQLTSDGDSFRLRASLAAYEGESATPVFERQWDKTLPRRLV
jgi:hypothetical protein